MDREPGRLQSMVSQRAGHEQAHTHIVISSATHEKECTLRKCGPLRRRPGVE